jgi:hypothetical protein
MTTMPCLQPSSLATFVRYPSSLAVCRIPVRYRPPAHVPVWLVVCRRAMPSVHPCTSPCSAHPPPARVSLPLGICPRAVRARTHPCRCSSSTACMLHCVVPACQLSACATAARPSRHALPRSRHLPARAVSLLAIHHLPARALPLLIIYRRPAGTCPAAARRPPLTRTPPRRARLLSECFMLLLLAVHRARRVVLACCLSSYAAATRHPPPARAPWRLAAMPPSRRSSAPTELWKEEEEGRGTFFFSHQ